MSLNPRIDIATINSIKTKTTCFNGTQYYDPSLQRFLGGNFNFYKYVGNSPSYWTDPSGLGKHVDIPINHNIIIPCTTLKYAICGDDYVEICNIFNPLSDVQDV
jgi:hypothetical protein